MSAGTVDVVVTGAGRGLGREVAMDLAAGGFRVLAADIDDEATASLAAEHDSITALHCDVAVEQSVAALMAAAGDRLRAVVHCAGLVAVTRAPAQEVTVEEFDRVMAVNARGSWLVARAAIGALAGTAGSLVLFTSDTAYTGSHGLAHYVASKGAVLSMMRAFAGEAGPSGVRVNAIAPGYTDTEGARAIGDPSRYDTAATPLGRVGRPADLLGTVRYLIDAGSAFVTGQSVHVNGGRYAG